MPDQTPGASGAPDARPPARRHPHREVAMAGSPGLADWLAAQDISLGFSTCQTNRLFLLGRGGWRHQRCGGGVMMHIPSRQIVAGGLSMPHSPRWFDGLLWLLNR